MAMAGLWMKAEVTQGPVCSHNEWDPLEEVIVGIVDGACVPPWDVTLEATAPREHRDFFLAGGGRPFSPELVAAAARELDELVRVLEAEGVRVRRPRAVDFSRPFAGPGWSSPSGLYAAMPRDLLLVVGDQILEVPMAWRCRYFEVEAFRPLLREYFRAGARWTAAPRPLLPDESYASTYQDPDEGHPLRYVIDELEPLFDAADFIRCGRDLFGQRSHVTNALGIEWLRRQLGPDYTVHELAVHDLHPMHIDASFMPLAPGKLLIHPERVRQLPPMFRHWDVRPAPPPVFLHQGSFRLCSRWVSLNVLMLDERRVVVECNEEPLIRLLRDWGFAPIPVSFLHFNQFGGSFHCATLDVRRRGELQSYF